MLSFSLVSRYQWSISCLVAYCLAFTCLCFYSFFLVTKSRPTHCDPMDCSPPGSFDHGISQARILEWVAISFSRGSSKPRDQTQVSCSGRRVLYHWAIGEAHHSAKTLLNTKDETEEQCSAKSSRYRSPPHTFSGYKCGLEGLASCLLLASHFPW